MLSSKRKISEMNQLTQTSFKCTLLPKLRNLYYDPSRFIEILIEKGLVCRIPIYNGDDKNVQLLDIKDQVLLNLLEFNNFISENSFRSILLYKNIISDVTTFNIEITYHGGSSFYVELEIGGTGYLLKKQIERIMGELPLFQCIFQKQYNKDGTPARDQDINLDAIEISDNSIIKQGDQFCLYICKPRIYWKKNIFCERNKISKNGLIVTHLSENKNFLINTNQILITGIHYFKVQIMTDVVSCLQVGVSKINLPEYNDYGFDEDFDTWLMLVSEGFIYGNGYHEEFDNTSKRYKKGDILGMILNLDNGSLTFTINGKKNGPGFQNGSITGPVSFAAQMKCKDSSIRIIEESDGSYEI